MSESDAAILTTGVRWSGYSNAGRVRKNNEDSFLGVHFNLYNVHHLGKFGEGSLESGDYAFAVSDGMGGTRAGEFASRIAVDRIVRLLPKSFRLAATGLDMGVADFLTELFEQIHKALLYLGSTDEDCAGMGATLSLGWVRPGWFVFGHVGDSRVYFLPQSGGIKQLSHDDTHVGWLLRNGQISEHLARTHPRRNVLQKALGAGHIYVEPQIGSVGCVTGDIFLIASDGLTDGLYDERLLQLIREPTPSEAQVPVAQRLVELSVKQSGRDNTTALVVEIL